MAFGVFTRMRFGEDINVAFSLRHGYGISAAPTSTNSGDRYIIVVSHA